MNRIEIESMLFGFALGDGWLSATTRKEGGNKYYQLGFSGDEESLEIAKKDLISLYSDIGKATLRCEDMNSPKYNIEGHTTQFICNTEVSKRFLELGLPVGKRVETEWLIPDWIMKGTYEIKRSFLSGFYAAEGYTPTMQRNDITIKAPGFNFHKRASQRDNFLEIVEQFSTLLEELEIEFNFFEHEKVTCDKNFVAEFIFKNSHENTVKFFNVMNVRYSVKKNKEIQLMKEYYKLKEKELNRMQMVISEATNPDARPSIIAKKYGVSINTIYTWRRRGTQEAKLPNNFIKYSEFKKQLTVPSASDRSRTTK